MIMVYRIHPVEGINEVSTHYLDVVHARYQAEEYYRGGGLPGATKMEVDSASTQISINTQGTMKDGKSQAIYKVIQACATTHPERGMNRQDLYRTFPHISENEMVRILEGMLEDGHIYSTVDSDHFLACF